MEFVEGLVRVLEYLPGLEDMLAISPSSCKAMSHSLSLWQCRSQRDQDQKGDHCSPQELGYALSAIGSSRGAKPFRKDRDGL